LIKLEKAQIHFSIAFLLSLAGAWAIFWGASDAGSIRDSARIRAVVHQGELLGYVELKPLELKHNLWSLDVFFNPLDRNLGVVREHKLRWWQIVDREGWEGYPRMDLQRGTYLPGSPGDDDDPAYYTRDEKLGRGGFFSPEEIFSENKYWLRDAPLPENGVSFEAWLVWQGDHEIERLVGFEWGLDANEGKVWRVRDPKFINESRYDLQQILEQSGFGSSWLDKTEATIAEDK
jgi:hypothetical protein